jgi:tRNA threonylcarbamoyladenosine biosynthesis protein TsaE
MPDKIHSTRSRSFRINSEPEMIAFGVKCAQCISPGQVIFLDGDLGTGKTTLAKGLMAGWSYTGRVTSPTFTLLESYDLSRMNVHHFDLYRMESADELEMIGARELFNSASICLIEWPDKAAGFLPVPDVVFTIEHCAHGRHIKIDGKTKAQLEECLQEHD